jgi:hypothetical protein
LTSWLNGGARSAAGASLLVVLQHALIHIDAVAPTLLQAYDLECLTPELVAQHCCDSICSLPATCGWLLCHSAQAQLLATTVVLGLMFSIR